MNKVAQFRVKMLRDNDDRTFWWDGQYWGFNPIDALLVDQAAAEKLIHSWHEQYATRRTQADAEEEPTYGYELVGYVDVPCP